MRTVVVEGRYGQPATRSIKWTGPERCGSERNSPGLDVIAYPKIRLETFKKGPAHIASPGGRPQSTSLRMPDRTGTLYPAAAAPSCTMRRSYYATYHLTYFFKHCPGHASAPGPPPQEGLFGRSHLPMLPAFHNTGHPNTHANPKETVRLLS